MLFVILLPHNLVFGVPCKRMVLKMWRNLLFLILLSADAQQLKFNKIFPNDSVPRDVEAREDGISYRLPNNTMPSSYLLSLVFGNFHDHDMSYTGDVSIVIRVLEDTQTITLHCGISISLNQVVLKNSANQEIKSSSRIDTRRDFLIIETPVTLQQGEDIILDIAYTGVIATETKGIFRGSYQHGAERR